MRISEQTRTTIRNTVQELFGNHATVLLFGSRVDESAKGGDIDLLVHSDRPVEGARSKSLQLVARLQMRLGDQPIDALVVDPTTRQQPIHKVALTTGVPL
jgi:predicted nucleotidyltransferase